MTVAVWHANNAYAPILVSTTAASTTVGARHVDATSLSVTIGINVIAVQMTPTSAPGLRAASGPEPNGTSTCHTGGCGNEGIAIPGYFAEDTVSAHCMACDQLITDIAAPAGHRLAAAP